MKNCAFDQYQRYNNIRNIINEMRRDNESFRILEVGANEHRNLENFLPLDKITYLDIQLPEELQKDPNYILGDATDMEFPDDEYDVIVALDVFEHIPLEKRNQFIDELYRVSSQTCIITAPFHSEETVNAESRVNSIYKSLFGEDYIWLAEHKENGLPNKDALKGYLQAKNVKFKMIGHGRLSIWEKLIGLHFFAAKHPDLAVYRQEIDKFYNSYIFDYDYTEESYRKIVVLEKGRSLDLSFETSSEIPAETLKTLETMERTFYNLCSMIGENKEENPYVDKVQIFIDNGDGFTESNSENFQFNDQKLIKFISVDLRSFDVIKGIRIDPSDYCGFYKIDNLKLIRANNDTEIKYQVTGNFDLTTSNMYLFEKDDPNILLNFESEVDIVRLELHISKLSINEIVNQYLNMLVSKENEITSLSNEISSKNNELTSKNNELTSKNNEIISINNDYIQQLEIKEAHEQKLIKENEDYQKINETLVDNLADNGRVIEKLNHEIEYLRAASVLCETEKQKLIQQLEVKEHELSSIYESKAWKLVVKARRVLGK